MLGNKIIQLEVIATLLVIFSLAGCTTPATSFLALNYSQPKISATPFDRDKVKKLTVPNNLFSNNVIFASKPSAAETSSAPGTGEVRPKVRIGDPWSIVLTRAYLEDVPKGWFDGSPNVAILLRVNSGDGSKIDGKWVLAAVKKDIEIPSYLNFDNLLVWSGVTGNAVVVDVQVVKLNKANKEQMSSYLSTASLISGAIPG